MSGTTNPKRTSRAKPKAATGTVSAAVEENSTVDAAQAEPEQVATQEPPQSMPEPQGSADEQKSEQDAEMTGSQLKVNQDEKVKDESSMDAAVQPSVNDDIAVGIHGAFKVRAKSDQGFWRSGIQFLRNKETVLLVVDEVPEDQPKTMAQEDDEPELVLFVTAETAKRIHGEPNLVVEVVELADVIDLGDTE
ncbi:hypothetical protein [Vibrio anguillarum]|uniref:hypothetical protein n=1 Tax=Vibrio anguillarum TaxID=55601 RepID=UPI0002E84295|nr:hypothetical protein [Vibrio anguillarum]OEE50473.1 hypothetical protein A1QU_10680 [Vibrio anguillarum]